MLIKMMLIKMMLINMITLAENAIDNGVKIRISREASVCERVRV